MKRPQIGPDLLSILLALQQRPKMFIRCESLALLEAYIDGFEMCERANGIRLPEGGEPSWADFVEWLRAKYAVSDQRGWFSVLEEAYEGVNEEKLLAVLFKEIEEFLGF